MRKKWLGLCVGLALFFGALQTVTAYEQTFSTGKDWAKRMSVREKYISLLPPTLLFHQYEVRLRHSLPEYIYLMDRVLLRNPQVENEDVGNIFASTIYLFEPQNRQALKNMEMSFLAGNFETKPYLSPRLTIDEILKEISG